VHHLASMPADQRRAAQWDDWVAFGGILLILVGSLNVVQGLLALLDDGYFVTAAEELALVNYDAWGVALLLWGVVLVACGAGLYKERPWARWPAIVAVIANVIAQIGFMPSRPLLSLVLIALDLTVLYALTARWGDAQRGYRGPASAR
jgi:hypothetical protein